VAYLRSSSAPLGWALDEHAFAPSNVSGMGPLMEDYFCPMNRFLSPGLTAPLVARGVFTSKGTRDLVIVAGSSDHVFALDAASGELILRFDSAGVTDETLGYVVKLKRPGPSSWLCPYSLNATPVMDPAPRRVFAITTRAACIRLHAPMAMW
jgi:hypothetical protein